MSADDHYCDSKPIDPFFEIPNRVLTIMGTVIGTCINIGPALLFIDVYKKRRTLSELPEAYLFANVVGNIVNVSYGFQMNDIMIKINSGVGTGFAVLYACIYIAFAYKKKIKMIIFHCFIFLNLAAELFFIFAIIFTSTKANGCLGKLVTGRLGIVFTIINSLTPGQNMYKVIKTGNYNLIPIFIIVFIFLCTFCWFIYGLFILELEMYLPNSFSVAFTAIQIVVYIIYYKKNKGKVFPPEDDRRERTTLSINQSIYNMNNSKQDLFINSRVSNESEKNPTLSG